MKFSSRLQIQELARFKGNDGLSTSIYLDTDKSRQTGKEIAVSFKNILGEARARLESMDLGKAKKESLSRDLQKIGSFGKRILPAFKAPGLAVFSSAGQNFWEDLSLPRAPRNHVIFDRGFYLRPLSMMLDEYRSVCVLLLDRHGARWYRVFMGEITLLDSVTGEVPRRVRGGGFQGYESKRIERHIDAHLHDHFKNAAQKTFETFKQNQFDWLFLGCKEEHRPLIEPLLHPYLRERFKGWLRINSYDSEAKILKQALEIEKNLKAAEEATLTETLVSELEKGGRAVSGLKEVLRKLNSAEALNLVVTRNFAQEGHFCPKCHSLYVDELRCPVCQVKTEKVLDVVHEGVHAAMDQKVPVRYVTPPSKLDRYGKVGAFLRFKS